MFKEKYFIAMVRSETTTAFDFIASCGGLLGLFMGISVLSIVELIYFFTLGLYCKNQVQTEPSGNARNCAKCTCLPIPNARKLGNKIPFKKVNHYPKKMFHNNVRGVRLYRCVYFAYVKLISKRFQLHSERKLVLFSRHRLFIYINLIITYCF